MSSADKDGQLLPDQPLGSLWPDLDEKLKHVDRNGPKYLHYKAVMDLASHLQTCVEDEYEERARPESEGRYCPLSALIYVELVKSALTQYKAPLSSFPPIDLPAAKAAYAQGRGDALEEAATVLDEMKLCEEDEAYDNTEAKKVGEGTTWNMAVNRAGARIRSLKSPLPESAPVADYDTVCDTVYRESLSASAAIPPRIENPSRLVARLREACFPLNDQALIRSAALAIEWLAGEWDKAQRSSTTPAWIEAELKDGDRLCEAADVQRTEGGSLPLWKLLHAIRDSKRYAARRRTIYETRLRLQVGGERPTWLEFVKEYDASCDKELASSAIAPVPGKP